MKLCNSTNSVQNFEDMSKCKNISLLTKVPRGAIIQLSFYHSVVGICIMPDQLHYVARIEYEAGIGVAMDPKSTFRYTTATHVPTIMNMMKITTDDEFLALEGDKSKQKKKLKTYAVLTPAITKAVEALDKTPSGAFIAVVNYLKTIMPTSDSTDTDAAQDKASNTTSSSR